ncbi:MAG: methylated-DNA--[protein]-cysteine S-methyltransferase [Spiroplasma sp.]|nr:methylated-DNA--[protein]-cysteine S-methyltransferase [Spiroplasma sp.]
MKDYGYYQSPIGLIEIIADDKIISLGFVTEIVDDNLINPNNLVINQCLMQLDQYFKQELTTFNLPLNIKGTPFQELVWKQASKIPYGKTITYQELAQKINKPTAVRAVGSALGKNRLAIFIPCHRVVASNNKIINYFWGKERKLFLQRLEKIVT